MWAEETGEDDERDVSGEVRDDVKVERSWS